MSSDSIDAENNISTLLNHQTHRLEDIANNAVDFIKINLLVLGAFAPFIATTFQAELSTSDLLESTYIQLATVAWTLSTFLTTGVYRVSRHKSTSQFELLEDAIVSDWRESDLRDEMLDNTSQYDTLVGRLMILLSVGIAASLMAVLYFALGIGDTLFDFPNDFKTASIQAVLIVGAIVGIGWEVKNGLSYVRSGGKRIFWGVLDIIPRVDLTARVSNILGRIRTEPTYDNILEYLIQSEGLSPIRARLLKEIHSITNFEPWRFDELSNRIQGNEIDIGVTKPMIERLVGSGYLRKVDRKGPSTCLIRTRDGQVVNGKELDQVVGEELGKLIGFLESNEVATRAAADVLGTERTFESVKQELVSGSASDRIEKLGIVVDGLRDSSEISIENGNVGKIIFRQQADTYQITPAGERPFALFRIQQAKNALRHEAYIQSAVLVSRTLEEFLTCLLFNHHPTLDSNEYRSFHEVIDAVERNGLISMIHMERIDDLRRIRNELVHAGTEQSIPEHLEEIKQDSGFAISNFNEVIETAEEIIKSYSD